MTSCVTTAVRIPIVVLVACGGHPSSPVPVQPRLPTPAANARCALRVEASAPVAAGPRATLSVKWSGEGSGEASRFVCIVVGDRTERVLRGEARSVEIRADAVVLQRIGVAGRTHLVYVPPNAEITIGDDPCFGYELSGPNTDAWFVAPPHAYCAAPGQACKPGFEHASSPRPVHDDLCGDTEPEIRRCIETGEVEVEHAGPLPAAPGRARGPRDPSHGGGDDDDVLSLASLVAAPVRLMPRTCGFAMLDGGGETVALAIGAGEKWTLAVDHGHVTGRVAR